MKYRYQTNKYTQIIIKIKSAIESHLTSSDDLDKLTIELKKRNS